LISGLVGLQDRLGVVSRLDLKQSIAATDALLTGRYAKTLVFTLSVTTP
jgi:hypothetical protein